MSPMKNTNLEQTGELLDSNGEVNIEKLLSAWNTATLRLQKTHQSLRKEVHRLTDELEIKNRELARKNRLADLGQLSSHIAHEFRNCLNPMTLYLSLLRRRLSEDSGSLDVLEKIDRGFIALDATVNDLLHFALDRQPSRQVFHLRDVIDEVCDSLSPQLNAQGIRVELEVEKRLSVCADRNMISRAVLNLMLNSLDAMPDGGELVITAWDGPGGVELEIGDSGPGLSEEQQERLFEPFFTTKDSGTGLGLAIVYQIMEAHGGKITATNCPEGGAAFTLNIPRYAMEAAA